MSVIRDYIEWSLDIAGEFAETRSAAWLMLIGVWLWTILVAFLFGGILTLVVWGLWELAGLTWWVGPLLIILLVVFARQVRSVMKSAS